MLELGELEPSDRVSLDRQQWMSIAQSGHFHPRQSQPAGTNDKVPVSAEDEAWEREREKARGRWLKEEGVETAEPGRLPQDEARRVAALAHDHETTRHLVEARATRKPPLMLAGIALLVVVGVGVAIWRGEGDDTIRASFEKVSNCVQSPGEGVSWAGCVRTGEYLRGVVLRNADLSGGNYDNADLSAADLSYANLRNASLRGAKLRAAKLLGTSLDGADLTGADLRAADLRYATLQGAILAGVRFDDATLGKATWSDGRPCQEGSVGSCR
jgi:hypothetical protein